MPKEKTIYACARLTGIMLLGATVVHATVGTAEVMTAIKTGEVRAGAADILRMVWIFSSIMLLLSAAWAFFLAPDLRLFKRKAWWQGVLLGLGYAGGAAACLAAYGFHIHLIAFLVIGLIILVPLITWAGHFRSVQKSVQQ